MHARTDALAVRPLTRQEDARRSTAGNTSPSRPELRRGLHGGVQWHYDCGAARWQGPERNWPMRMMNACPGQLVVHPS